MPVSWVLSPDSEMVQSQFPPEEVHVAIGAPASVASAPPKAVESSSQVMVVVPTVRQLVGTMTVSESDSVTSTL